MGNSIDFVKYRKRKICYGQLFISAKDQYASKGVASLLNILNGFDGPIDTNNNICLGQMDLYTLIKATMSNKVNDGYSATLPGAINLVICKCSFLRSVIVGDWIH